MPVLTNIVAELRYGVRRVVSDPVLLKDPGIDPYTVSLTLQDKQLLIRANGIQILLCNIISLQVFTLQDKPVISPGGIAFYTLRHKVQRFLFVGTYHIFTHIHIFKAYACSHMNMAVNDTGHDKPAAEVFDLTFIVPKPRFVPHIDKPAVLYRYCGGLPVFRISCKYLRILNDKISLHVFPPFRQIAPSPGQRSIFLFFIS